MKKVLILILNFFVILTIAVLVGGFLGSKTGEETARADYESDFRDSYIKGCVSQGSDEAVCSCVFDRLNEIYGFEGLKEISAPFESLMENSSGNSDEIQSEIMSLVEKDETFRQYAIRVQELASECRENTKQ